MLQMHIMAIDHYSVKFNNALPYNYRPSYIYIYIYMIIIPGPITKERPSKRFSISMKTSLANIYQKKKKKTFTGKGNKKDRKSVV